MNFKTTLSVMTLLAGWLVIPGPLRADQAAAKDAKREPIAARTLLEEGRASGSLPEGMIVRVSACLGEHDGKAAGARVQKELRETWEFTSGEVRRIRPEDEDEKKRVHPVESRPFDSKGLCQELLEGKAIEIQAGKGKGPEVGFVGSHYQRGGRSIEVVWKGETVLHLFETNGPTLKFYRESDARAFGALYERLAGQARDLFQSKAAEAK